MKKKKILGRLPIYIYITCASSILGGISSLTGCTISIGGDTPEPEPEPVGGSIFNIASYNQEFKNIFKKYISDEKDESANPCHLNGVEVSFTIIDVGIDAYLTFLNNTLPDNATQPEETKIDLFMAEQDYIYDYVNSEYTNSIANLGMSRSDFPNAYNYAVDICTDTNNAIKGTCLNFCPTLLIYRRDIAKQVLGSDDPNQVGEKLNTWDGIVSYADKVKETGNVLYPTYESAYRPIYNNISQPWVQGGKLVIDPSRKKWAQDTYTLVQEQEVPLCSTWSDDWGAYLTKDGNDGKRNFIDFVPCWTYTWSYPRGEELGDDGNWGVCPAPQCSNWGGSWSLAATGGDNDNEVKTTIEALNNSAILTQISLAEGREDFFSNNTIANSNKSKDRTNDFLGGQNDWVEMCKVAPKIEYKNATHYDLEINNIFIEVMKGYFEHEFSDYTQAIARFKERVHDKFPEIDVS